MRQGMRYPCRGKKDVCMPGKSRREGLLLCGVPARRLCDHGEGCGFLFRAALYLFKLRDPAGKLRLRLPLLLCRQLLCGEGADADGALLILDEERGADGKAELR